MQEPAATFINWCTTVAGSATPIIHSVLSRELYDLAKPLIDWAERTELARAISDTALLSTLVQVWASRCLACVTQPRQDFAGPPALPTPTATHFGFGKVCVLCDRSPALERLPRRPSVVLLRLPRPTPTVQGTSNPIPWHFKGHLDDRRRVGGGGWVPDGAESITMGCLFCCPGWLDMRSARPMIVTRC